jgi:hypothetical protein
MKKYYFFLFILLFSFSLNAKELQFIEGFEDIPLNNNMKQVLDNDISFNNEETGYIETNLIATKKISFNQFKRFYIETLPQLGWNLHINTVNNLIFYRENNILEFLKLKDTPLKVSISLKNRN